MGSDRLFGPALRSAAIAEMVSDAAWVQAMLDVEAAIARAEAEVGVIPSAAADSIARCCRVDLFDVEALGREAAQAGNPVVPLVKALTRTVTPDASGYVHWGATSQDVLDTAMVLIARRAVGHIVADLDGAAASCAELADRHRGTVMAARTLLQQALPIPFGLKAAGWLGGTLHARRWLRRVGEELPLQLGGAAGSLAALGTRGLDVTASLSRQLALPEPSMPWHTIRGRVAELGAALATTAGMMGKVATDIMLLTQTEVAEVSELAAPERGRSSSMPHKRNPIASVEVIASARLAQAQASVLFGCMLQEHERAAGAWQAEWPAVTELLRLAGGAAMRIRETLTGLQIHPDRMLANMELTGGLLMSEHVAMVLASRVGRDRAYRAVEAAAARSASAKSRFREVLLEDVDISSNLTPDELDAALDPAAYLGASEQLIDRAIMSLRKELGGD